jgi:hypothetical protein
MSVHTMLEEHRIGAVNSCGHMAGFCSPPTLYFLSYYSPRACFFLRENVMHDGMDLGNMTSLSDSFLLLSTLSYFLFS